MHVAMHNWMRAEPIETTIARLASSGYDAIEISGEPERYDTRHVRKLLEDAGLRCWGSVTLMLAERDLLAKDEAQRAASVQYVNDCITMVKELGGVEITIVPSTVGKVKPQGSPEDEWKWAVESLKQCYEHGQREGVKLALEPLNRFETDVVSTTAQGIAVVDAVGHSGLGLLLDTFHMNMEDPSIAGAIRQAGRRLVHFQANESHRGFPGTGHVDWPDVMRALVEIGYDGPISLEPFRRNDQRVAVPLATWRPPLGDESEPLKAALALIRSTLALARTAAETAR